MSRRDDERLEGCHRGGRGTLLGSRVASSDGLVFDAVRVRLIEIGEAVGTSPALLAREPEIPWADVAGMRDHLCSPLTSTRRIRSCGRIVDKGRARALGLARRLREDVEPPQDR